MLWRFSFWVLMVPVFGTRYATLELAAPDIRERVGAIRSGMTTEDVKHTVGEPVNTAGGIWRYTWEGGCERCNSAWLMLAVRMERDRVTQVINQWERN